MKRISLYPQLYMSFSIVQAAATLIQSCVDFISYVEPLYGNYPLRVRVMVISQYAYLLIELICCTLFIRASIINPVLKKIITLYTLVVLIILACIFFINPFELDVNNTLFTIENICLTASCLLYFIDLFRQPPTRHLLQEPAFWAISGMLLLFSIGTPLFLLFDVLGYHYAVESIYLINYILYCILYLTYLKAIQCSRAQQK